MKFHFFSKQKPNNLSKIIASFFCTTFALVLVYFFSIFLPAEGAILKQINYQGKLNDSTGSAVTDGTYQIVFKLYTASSGGVAIWTESWSGANEITVTDGLFSVMLGSITSIASVDFNQTLYLGVTVESDSEMTPRKTLGSVATAILADSALTVITNANLTGPITSVGNATSIASQTGTGTTFVMNTSPTLVTPILGVATATSINKVAITAPATSATLTLADGSSLVTSGANSITLTSSGATNVTLPTSGTLATLAGTETLSGKTLTTPRFANAGYIADANGNELLIFTTTASAVNEWTLANGSTGVNPTLTASGETNVGLDFQAKGTGVYRLLGTADQAAELRLFEDTTDGTNYTAFKVGIQSADITYTLPVNDGDASQLLTTDGSGVLSWTTVGGGGWTDDGTTVRLSTATDSVGIGTASPTGNLGITQTIAATGALKGIVYTGAVNTNQTLSTEIPSVTITTAGRQWATGALTTQREVVITQPTYSFVGASTITTAATFAVAGAPIKSTNASITNTYGILVQATSSVSTATNSYGLTVNAQTGATNNYSATFLGGNVGIGTTAPSDTLEVVGNVVSKGTAWTTQTVPNDNSWRSIAYGNGLFVSTSDDGTATRVMTSPDGVNWTTRDTTGKDNAWNAVAYGNGIFVAVGSSGTATRALTSPDGITWTTRDISADNNWRGIAYGNGKFVAVAGTGTNETTNLVATSLDGITWTNQADSVDNSWQSVTYGNGLFVAVASTGTGDRVMTSPDGVTWTTRTSATDNGWFGVTYGNGLFVAVANTGTGDRVMTSPDGVTWTSRTSAADNGWRSVTYGNGLFVAVASSGTGDRVMTSPDGINWKTRTSAADTAWNAITYGNGRFVAVATTSGGSHVMTSGKPETNPLSHNNLYQGGLYVYGSMGVGTTSPGQKFSVVGDTGDTAVVSIVTTGGNTCTFSTSTGLFSCASDERLKHDIVSIEGTSAVSSLSKLHPVTYHYNWQSDEEPVIAGFIAQEFEKVFPSMVFTDKEGYKSLSYSALMPYAIKAIQELDLRITALETGTDNTDSISKISSFFNDVVDKVEGGVAFVRGLVVDSLKVGTPEKRTGIVFYDEVTGEPYCLTIYDQEPKATPGECTIIVNSPTSTNTPSDQQPESVTQIEQNTNNTNTSNEVNTSNTENLQDSSTTNTTDQDIETVVNDNQNNTTDEPTSETIQ